MTNEKAIKVLKNLTPKTCKMINGRYKGGFDDTKSPAYEAIQLAVEALEKQIPKKCTDGFHKEKFIDGRCPNCSFRQSKGDIQWKRQFNKYCRNCGQALDWSDSE